MLVLSKDFEGQVGLILSKRELGAVFRGVECQQGAGIPYAVWLNPQLQAGTGGVPGVLESQRPGTVNSAVLPEVEAIPLMYPGHAVPGSVKRPQSQCEGCEEDSTTNKSQEITGPRLECF